MVGEKALYAPAARDDFVWAVVGSPWGWLALWLAAINLAAFFTFGADKWRAKRREQHPQTRRIRERTLFLLAILGGSVGALLGMRVFHHKTLHRSFRVGIPLILLAQLILPAGIYLYLHYLRG
ncbi:MAG: DUF1294 domain-containing protein [Oscillibacter sp.]|nr:DUF1294 domain-containing protein [Oscillibacter sp.]